MIAPRKPWLAAVLSLIFPGLGHLYVGQLRSGLLWWAVPDAFLISGLLLCVAFPERSAAIIWGRVVPVLALRLVQAVLAWSEARRAGPGYRLKSVNRGWVYLVFALATWAVGSGSSDLIRSRVMEPFRIPSASMVPTLEPGDQIYTFKAGPGARLDRGAVVVWNNRNVGKALVSRIVALGGDTVTVEDGHLAVSGRQISEEPCVPLEYSFLTEWDGQVRTEHGQCFVEHDGAATRSILHTGGRFAEGSWQVPQGTMFLVSDNRENANDSRVEGPVPLEDVIGRGWAIWLSFPPGSWVPRFERIGLRL